MGQSPFPGAHFLYFRSFSQLIHLKRSVRSTQKIIIKNKKQQVRLKTCCFLMRKTDYWLINASERAFIALTPWSRAIRTEILISEVEIIMMLISAS